MRGLEEYFRDRFLFLTSSVWLLRFPLQSAIRRDGKSFSFADDGTGEKKCRACINQKEERTRKKTKEGRWENH